MNYSVPKLLDCQPESTTFDLPEPELFVVEGDSAARTMARVRDERFQAILPKQGKPMNALKSNRSDLEKNVQFAALIESLGVELRDSLANRSRSARLKPDDTINSSPVQTMLFETDEPQLTQRSARFQNVILLFDPDADGIHSRTLMLLFFYRWLRPWLDAGRVFDAHVPQWIVTGRGLRESVPAATPEQLHQIRSQLAEQGISEIRAQRFRGLGSVDGTILNELCVDPKTRTLTRLTTENATAALAVIEQFRIDHQST